MLQFNSIEEKISWTSSSLGTIHKWRQSWFMKWDFKNSTFVTTFSNKGIFVCGVSKTSLNLLNLKVLDVRCDRPITIMAMKAQKILFSFFIIPWSIKLWWFSWELFHSSSETEQISNEKSWCFSFHWICTENELNGMNMNGKSLHSINFFRFLFKWFIEFFCSLNYKKNNWT